MPFFLHDDAANLFAPDARMLNMLFGRKRPLKFQEALSTLLCKSNRPAHRKLLLHLLTCKDPELHTVSYCELSKVAAGSGSYLGTS